ncbi:MAG: NosD domain-containing protein, partial [Candidatus Micrarchaeia archaeon]
MFNINYGLSYLNNCSNLNINGETYILTTNVSSTTICFNISANNITLDCNGNTIYSYNNAVANASIITNAALTGIVIKNCNFIGNDSYILFFPYGNLNSKLINNSFKNCYYCSWIQSDNNISIINNSFYNSRNAIHFVGTSGFNISNNLFSNISSRSISAGGLDSNPSLVKVIENNFFLNTYRGIYNGMTLTHINSNEFYNCGEYCIYLASAQNNSIFNNNISNYSIYGLILDSSLGTNISTNIFNSTVGSAIVLRSSDVISVFNNTIYGPLILESSRNDTIFNNTILTAGIALHAYSPYYENENNQIFNNSIVSIDSYAIRLVSSKNNLIYNNILKGSVPVEVVDTLYTNYWNTTINCSGARNIVGGPCIGGNFYSNLNETGFSENINVCSPQSNKICGNSYTIQTNNIDYAPITNRLLAPSCSSQLNEPNTIYIMWSSQVTPGTCYTITANNVTLDCKGYTITYATGSNYAYGIYSGGYNNSVIKNCKLIQNTAPRNNAHGIWFAGSSNNKVENVSINIVGNQSNGIYLTYSWPNPSNYNFIKNTTITMSGVQGHGIDIYGSYNNFSNISIVTTGMYGNGINFDPSSDSNYNIFTNMSVKDTGSYSFAIQLRGNDNRFYNNLINSSSTSPVSVTSGSNSFNTTLTMGTNIIGGNYIAGNFWATPSGNGFSETCTDNDGNGICDATYTINSDNIDYLPLAVPPIQLTSCGTLDKTGKTYLLIQNITTSNDCFIINKSYITLDCQNNTITANRGVLIGFPGRESSSNITVKNCIINSAYDGIDLGAWSYNTNITILGNKIISQYANGIAFGTVAGSNINISNNIIYSPRWGIYIVSGSGYITNNTIVQVDCNYGGYPPCGGLILYGGSNFNILHNFINSTNAHGIVFADYLGTTADNNLVINNLIYTNYCGFRFQPYSKCGARNNIIANSTIIAIGTNSCGIYSDCPINTTWSNITINSEGTDFISLYSINNTYFNVTFNSSFYPTKVSFTHNGSIKINSADAVPSSGYYNVSKYLNITNSTPAWVYINFTYSNDTIGENETKLKLYRWDGSAWNEVPGSGVDTDNKIVYGNITQFSIFAPLAVADAIPPSIQLISPENDTYTNQNSMTFIFNATDDQSSTLNCSLYINNEINQTNESFVNGSVTSFSLTNIADGYYTWYVNCSDASGNSNVSETRTFTIDTIPPSVSITSPSSNSYLNSKIITITGTSSDLNYNFTNISIWQGSTLINSTITTSTSWSVQLGVQNDGIYNITATAYDKVGYNNSSSVQNIRIDTIPPSVSITSPSSNSYLNSKIITITGTSSDLNYNFTNISIWQGSTLINSTITTSTSWSVQLGVQNDGIYNITATAYDYAANINSTSATSITIDTIYPTISFISPTPANNIWIVSNEFTINVSHSEINPSIITLFINDSVNQTRQYSGSFTNFTVILPDGTYNYYVRINDSAGNTNQTETRIIRIDTIPPSVSITSPSSNSYLNSKIITITGTSSDLNYNFTNISIWQGSTLINSTITTSTSWSVQLGVQNDGIYNITATAYD